MGANGEIDCLEFNILVPSSLSQRLVIKSHQNKEVFWGGSEWVK